MQEQSSKPKIGLLYGSAGEGHHKAALALQAALEQIDPTIQTEILNTYDFVNPFKRWQYQRAWIFVTRYLSGTVRASRQWLDNNPKFAENIKRGFIPAAQKLGSYMQKHNITALVSTHPHGAGLGGIIKENPNAKDLYLAEVFTDFQYHEFYNNKGVDHFFSATAEAAAVLQEVQPGANISVTGVPVHPNFSKSISREEARAAFGIPVDDKPVVLVTRGSAGWGSNKTLEILEGLTQLNLPMHIVAHAGRKPRLVKMMRASLKESVGDNGVRLVLGWVDNMWDLFEAADLYVGKPGGMQLSECLARFTPVLAFDPIPGTEEHNASLLQDKGAGLYLDSPAEVLGAIKEILGDKNKFEQMRLAAKRIGKPLAASEIATAVVADLHKSETHPQNSGNIG